jgi:hypothetical protein
MIDPDTAIPPPLSLGFIAHACLSGPRSLPDWISLATLIVSFVRV